MITQTNPLKPKKKRTYKGKKIERPETDRERKDRNFPGYDELKRISTGIMEDEEETQDKEGCLIDDEINDDPEGSESDCLIPLKWAKLASSNLATQEKMKQTIQEARDRKKKKETKKNCEPGNPWRDDLGRMTSPDKAASWSIGNKSGVGRPDCNYGKKKKTGSGRSTSWTRRECGREDVEDPNIKAKHRCKDGSVVKEGDSEVLDSAWEKTTGDVFGNQISDRLQKVLDRDPNFIKHLSFLLKPMIDKEKGDQLVREKRAKTKGMNREEIRQLCSASGFFGWTDFLLKLSAIEQAKKGTINKTPQNK